MGFFRVLGEGGCLIAKEVSIIHSILLHKLTSVLGKPLPYGSNREYTVDEMCELVLRKQEAAQALQATLLSLVTSKAGISQNWNHLPVSDDTA